MSFLKSKTHFSFEHRGSAYVALVIVVGWAVPMLAQNPTQYESTPQLGQVYPQGGQATPAQPVQPDFKMGNSSKPGNPVKSTSSAKSQPLTADDLPAAGNLGGAGVESPRVGLSQDLPEANTNSEQTSSSGQSGVEDDLSLLEAKRLTAEFDRAVSKGSQSGPPEDLLQQLRNLSLRATPAGSWARRTLVRLFLAKGGGGPGAAEDFISRAPADQSRELLYYYARQMSRQDPGRASAALDKILARAQRDKVYVLAGILQLRLNLRQRLMGRAKDNLSRLLRLAPSQGQSEARLEQMGLLDDFYFWAARYYLAPGQQQNIRRALEYLKPFEVDPVLGSRPVFAQSIWAPAAVRLRRQMAAIYSIGRL